MQHLNNSSKESSDLKRAFNDNELRELSGKTSELLTKLNNLSDFFSTEQEEASSSNRLDFSREKNSNSVLQPISNFDLNKTEIPPAPVSYLEEHKKQISSSLNGNSYIKRTSESTFFQSNQSESRASRKSKTELFDYSFKDNAPELQKQIDSLDFPTEEIYSQTKSLPNKRENQPETRRFFSGEEQKKYKVKDLNPEKKYKPYKHYVDTNKFKEREAKKEEYSSTNYLRPVEPEESQPKKEKYQPSENTYDSREILEDLDRIEKNLSKVSKTFRKNSNLKLDIVRVLAWLAPVFALSFPFNLIKLLGLSLIDNFVISVSLFAMSLFFGIFIFKIALRIVEISEITNWSHKQIFLLKSVLSKSSKRPSDQE